jgi:hypothetical protein
MSNSSDNDNDNDSTSDQPTLEQPSSSPDTIDDVRVPARQKDFFTELKGNYTSVSDTYNRFSLRKTIQGVREEVNEKFDHSGVFREVIKIGSHPASWKNDLHTSLYRCSSKINEDYPYLSSLARTQEPMFILTSALFVSIPLFSKRSLSVLDLSVTRPFLGLSRKRLTIFTLSALSAKALAETINYKWKYPESGELSKKSE